MDLLSIFQNMLDQTKHLRKERKRAPIRWKYCIALAARGWRPSKYEKVADPENPSSDDIMVSWNKEGNKKTIKIQLTFLEQCLWLEYVSREEDLKNVKSKQSQQQSS